MSLHAAIRMMFTPVEVDVRSDAALARLVAAAQSRELTKPQKLKLVGKQAIVAASEVHGVLRFTPLEAMLELAVGTALHRDPTIAGFARGWSTLRYLGVFARDTQGLLHLDAAALDYVGANQRRVISEELGIGIGILVAKEWCQARQGDPLLPVSVTDFDKALYDSRMPSLSQTGRRQPDYVLSYPGPANSTIYELLETKGSVSMSNATNQLGHATTQLASITVNNTALTGLAVATVSTVDSIRVRAVDPPAPDVSSTPTAEELEYWRTADPRPRQSTPVLDIPVNELAARTTNAGNAALAEFSGQYDTATRWLPRLERQRPTESNADARQETDLGTFVGTEYGVDVPGTKTRIRIYQAVEEHIASAMHELDGAEVRARQLAFAERRRETPPPLAPASDGTTAQAISSDGALLRISIE